MKKVVYVICALAFIISCMCTGVYADGVTILSEEKVLNISEQFSSKTGLTVTVASAETESINSENLPVFMYLYSTDSKGVFEEDIHLSEKLESGKYIAYIDAPGDSREIEFFYVNPESKSTLDVIDAVNDCDSGEEILGLLNTDINAALVGLDTSSDDYATYALYAFDFCAESKDDDFTFDTFAKSYAKGISVAKVLEEIKSTEVYGELEDVIKENAELFEIDFDGDYDDIKQKSKVYVEMFKNKADIDGYASVKEVFDEAVKKVLKAQKNSESSSSGNGSSSSGKGSVVVIPSTDPVVDNNKPVIQPAPVVFADLENHFSKVAVTELVSKNVISGYPDGTFKPDAGVTRAEFSKIASLAFGYEPKVTGAFSDVNSDDWFSGFVDGLNAAGIVGGYDGKFNPNDTITRQDAACIIYRIIKDKLSLSDKEAFADETDVSDYAKEAVASLHRGGVVNGNNNMFNPRSVITRGEVAVMILNALNINS